jgi:hypothetical protein
VIDSMSSPTSRMQVVCSGDDVKVKASIQHLNSIGVEHMLLFQCSESLITMLRREYKVEPKMAQTFAVEALSGQN